MNPTDPSRRTLLQLAAGAGTAAMLAPARAQGARDTSPTAQGQPLPNGVPLPEAPYDKPSEDSLGYAIVGLGGYALRQIMPAFAGTKRAHVAGLVSGNKDKARRVGAAYGVPEDALYDYDDFDRIAEDDRIDAVYVVLPTGLHAEYTERALRAGKHVMCEKAMAVSSAECERMIRAAKAADRKLMIGYRCHFEPYNRAAMDLMAEDAIGRLGYVRTLQTYVAGEATPSENWRFNRALAGGGPLEDYGIYGLQAALYLTGEMPERVTATAFRPENDPRFSEIFATVQTQLGFPSGAVGQLVTSYDMAGLNRVEARGTRGVLEMEPATGYGGHTMTLTRGGAPERLEPGDPSVQFARQIDHLADAVRDGTEIRTPGEMGLRDIRIIEAIYRAAETGRTIRLHADGRMRG